MLVTDQPESLPTTNALDGQPVQGALIEAAFVRFNGSSNGALEDPPALDEERTYIVKATCIELKHKRNKDHEERVTAVMEIDSCFERGKVPIVDENQGSLFGEGEEPAAGDDGE